MAASSYVSFGPRTAGRPLGPQAALCLLETCIQTRWAAQTGRSSSLAVPLNVPSAKPPPVPPPASAPDGHEHGVPRGAPAQDTRVPGARPGRRSGKGGAAQPPRGGPAAGGTRHSHRAPRSQRAAGPPWHSTLVCRVSGAPRQASAGFQKFGQDFSLSVTIRPANR